ncbi:putative methyltransferases [Magnetospirillum sp. XM-1]|uniref:FkbM family methyltransferase n=1 Tax=Magnetospirillum sp. XM-1 TaxID=1663591 RepID=UPI00073DD373|nr:FkbM family methyltransferase [Magnetospirillum sp. XM-1]CUW38084.1 putative methyltransferases [Magnetospirillum sp. XM-1]
MTPSLLLQAGLGPLLAAHPLACLDVGSRGGFESDLLPIAGAVDAIGFEPEPAAFRAVSGQGSGPWRSLRHLPHALAGTTGERTLYVPQDPASSSLLRHDPAIAGAFGKRHFSQLDHAVAVQTRVLDDVLDEANVTNPAYLKLDVEGAELEILEAAPRALEHLLTVKAEVSFLPFRHGQPLAGDVEAFLRGHDFVLMDLMRPHHWRVHGYVAHPQAAAQTIPYSRGQLVQGDFLFFRSPDSVQSMERRLQLAALAMAHGHFDFAGRILLEPATTTWLARTHGCDASGLLDRCSQAFGRTVWRHKAAQHLRRMVTFARSWTALWGRRAP